MESVEYSVPAIHCMHCLHTIKTELGDLEGVKFVEADLETKKVAVHYDAPATPKAIEDLLAEINYPVEK